MMHNLCFKNKNKYANCTTNIHKLNFTQTSIERLYSYIQYQLLTLKKYCCTQYTYEEHIPYKLYIIKLKISACTELKSAKSNSRLADSLNHQSLKKFIILNIECFRQRVSLYVTSLIDQRIRAYPASICRYFIVFCHRIPDIIEFLTNNVA